MRWSTIEGIRVYQDMERTATFALLKKCNTAQQCPSKSFITKRGALLPISKFVPLFQLFAHFTLSEERGGTTFMVLLFMRKGQTSQNKIPIWRIPNHWFQRTTIGTSPHTDDLRTKGKPCKSCGHDNEPCLISKQVLEDYSHVILENNTCFLQ